MASDDIWAYEEMQRNGYGTARMDTTRATKFMAFINKNVQPGATILDASCGRGILLKMMREAGYAASGTEASEYLVSEVLPPLPSIRLTYSELKVIEDQSADVVISNDVLEHLDTINDVMTAIANIARISRRWVMFSVGLNEAVRIVRHKRVVLHRIVKPWEWWQSAFMRYCKAVHMFTVQNSFFYFGERQEWPITRKI